MTIIKVNLDYNQGYFPLTQVKILITVKVMINEYICYKCKCDKCGREWITKSHDVPNVCPKCHSVKWNEFSAPATQIDAIRTPQTVQPSQPIKDEPKDALTAFIEKAQAKKGIAPSEIISEPETIEENWQFTKEAGW